MTTGDALKTKKTKQRKQKNKETTTTKKQCWNSASTLVESTSTLCWGWWRGSWTERPYVGKSAKCSKTFDQDCSSGLAYSLFSRKYSFTDIFLNI